MVGAAVCRRLSDHQDVNLITASRQQLDLTDRKSVDAFFNQQSIDVVVFAAAKVGGIVANNTIQLSS